MKTIMILALLGFLASCASHQKCEEKKQEEKTHTPKHMRFYSPADRLR